MQTAYERAPTIGRVPRRLPVPTVLFSVVLFPGSPGRKITHGKVKVFGDDEPPVQDVWTTMLNDATYREWTGVFNSDYYFRGGLEPG